MEFSIEHTYRSIFEYIFSFISKTFDDYKENMKLYNNEIEKHKHYCYTLMCLEDYDRLKQHILETLNQFK